jgi:hypothetical protein
MVAAIEWMGWRRVCQTNQSAIRLMGEIYPKSIGHVILMRLGFVLIDVFIDVININ